MTHEEYLARLESLTDSAGDVAAVLAHAGACGLCRRDERAVHRALARLKPVGKSLAEEVARWSAAAAILVLIVLGFHREARETERPLVATSKARYVIVGDSSGVTAYTPEGVVVGVAEQGRPSEKGIER
jgi:hypothetical protein